VNKGKNKPITESKSCELCDNPRVKGERYCPRHRTAKLKEMKEAGYFTDTEERTVFEYERQQNERMRSQRQRDAVEDMMDRLDSYRDRANENEPANL
jgi:hypothetical protein